MGRLPQILDRWGRPMERAVLKTEIATPTLSGVRSPLSGYPADGLNPIRLASILREADQGDPVRYLELAETIEERDPHYLAVLATRKRAVSQIEITVEAASDDPEDTKRADLIRDWLKRDDLTSEVFHILDCLGKGYSLTEIEWDFSGPHVVPKQLHHRDPRWFRFDRTDLSTPMLLDENGQEKPLPGGKFIYANIQAKSGLALRSGLARVAAWGWMFKMFTQRDWAIFTQTYGQPLRVGKYGPGASKEDRDTIFRAVANIAGDCAAIIPDSMEIEFVQSSNVGASSELYKERADWLDQQISKAVLGQTATTDAVTGGLGSGKEHRQVQEDIETADARALAAILNRDLIRPWMQIAFGPMERYPRLIIARPEAEDLKAAAEALAILVPLGMKVGMNAVRDKFGWSEPAKDEEILAPAPPPADVTDPQKPNSILQRVSGEFERGKPLPGSTTTLHAQQPSTGLLSRPAATDILADRLETEAGPALEAMLGRIDVMIGAAGSFEELAEMVRTGFPTLDATGLADVLAQAMTLANAAGRVAVAEDLDD